MGRGEQEQRKEEAEGQGDDDKGPVHLRPTHEAHPGHGDEPQRRGKDDSEAGWTLVFALREEGSGAESVM